jgi:glycerate 2-kinase
LARALTDRSIGDALRSTPVHVVAVGKAAADMIDAWCAVPGFTTRVAVAIGPDYGGRAVREGTPPPPLPSNVEWRQAAHPLPDERSVAAASRALAVARAVPPDETLLILLSGGASALMAMPMDGISLTDKQHVVNAMLKGGADIHALNTLRKHLSAVKGGRLAAACRARTITLAISDVVGDDLAVIGSGPGIPDPSTWRDAAAAFDRYVAVDQQPPSVMALLAKGLAGELPDTPKPRDAVSARVIARVIAGRFDAMAGAREAAERLGYDVEVIHEPVVGDASKAAVAWFERVAGIVGAVREGTPTRKVRALGTPPPPLRRCVISSGETTVRVTGSGQGGRNQEFVLALAEALSGMDDEVVAASVGTDGIDGPTDAAGALVDSTTFSRATALGVYPAAYLDDNNSYAFFDALGDLIRTGATGTNVGDLQVIIT